ETGAGPRPVDLTVTGFEFRPAAATAVGAGRGSGRRPWISLACPLRLLHPERIMLRTCWTKTAPRESDKSTMALGCVTVGRHENIPAGLAHSLASLRAICDA